MDLIKLKNENISSFSIEGREIKVNKGVIEIESKDLEIAISHGFEVVMEEENITTKKKGAK